jgi:hypothetical protein
MKLSLVLQGALWFQLGQIASSSSNIRARQDAHGQVTTSSVDAEYLEDEHVGRRRATLLAPTEAKVKKDIEDYINKKHHGDMCTAFDAFDTNSDGKLDKNELKTALDKIADEQNGVGRDWGSWAGPVANEILDEKKTIKKGKLKGLVEEGKHSCQGWKP